MVYSPDAQTTLAERGESGKQSIDVAFQGERGAFGDEAARFFFGQREARGAQRQVNPVPCKPSRTFFARLPGARYTMVWCR